MMSNNQRPRCEGTRINRAGRGLRRGSVLVLALGVLAMLSLLVLVYFSIGRADRREGATAVANARANDVIGEIRAYIAGVIGADALAVERQRDVLGNDHVRRRVRTYPGVDPEARSLPGFPVNTPGIRPGDNPAEERARKFDPSGSINTPWPGGAGSVDPRLGVSPMLASSSPTWLNRNAEPITSAAFPDWLAPSAGALPTNVSLYLHRRDWLSISNLSPNGLFVNLAALRGNFEARPGIGFDQIREPDGNTRLAPRMSQWLTLLDQRGESYPVSTATNGTTPSLRADGLPAHLNRPWDWSSHQLNVVQPVNAGFYPAGDPRNIANQWVDTDGDGIPDARRFELTDLWFDRNPNDPLPAQPWRAKSLISTIPGMRIFVAARVEDLSGRVNVNSALEFRRPPTLNYPGGASPSDIDLARWLDRRDDEHAGRAQVIGLYPQPQDPRSRSYYADYDGVRREAGGAGYRSMIAARMQGAIDRVGGQYFPEGVEPLGAGYTTALGLDTAGAPGLTPQARWRLYALFGGRDPLAVSAATGAGATDLIYRLGAAFTLDDQLELMRYGGLNDHTVTSRLEAALDGRDPNAPRVGPLRSNRALEVERDQSEFARQILRLNTDPRRGLTVVSGARPLASTVLEVIPPTSPSRQFNPPPLSERELLPDINALRDDIIASLDWTRADVATARRAQQAVATIFRGYADALLPFSGLRDAANNRAALNPADLRMRALYYGGLGRQGATNHSAFEAALRAAAHMTANFVASTAYFPPTPVPGDPLSQRSDAGTHRPLRPLGDETVAFTLKIDGSDFFANSIYPGANPDLNGDGADEFPFLKPVDPARNRTPQVTRRQPAITGALDLDEGLVTPTGAPVKNSRLADENTALTSRIINVYGITAHPVITEVAVFAMYTDTDVRHGGDTEFTGGGGGGGGSPFPGGGGGSGNFSPITIDGRLNVANPDFLMEIAVVQLSNPFDVPIPLSGYRYVNTSGGGQVLEPILANGVPVPDREFRYYIEFAGRFYALIDAGDDDSTETRDSLVLQPGETRNFILATQDLNVIAARWRRADPTVPAGPTAVRNWINNQASISLTNSTPRRLMPFNPYTGERLMANPQDLGVISPQRAGLPVYDEGNRTVRLWKRVDADGDRRTLDPDPNPGAGEFYNPRSDQLVDRLRDPADTAARATLDRRLPARVNDIPGTEAGPDDTQGGVATTTSPRWWRDNSGYSITIAASIRRPNLPAGVTLPTGALPPWVLEVKSSLQTGTNPPTSLNKEELVPATLTGQDRIPARRDFRDTSPSGSTRFKGDATTSLWRRQTAGSPILPQLTRPPQLKTGNSIPRAWVTTTGTPTRAGPEFRDLWVQLSAARYRAIETDGNQTRYELPPPVGPADLLRPLAVGPWHDPRAYFDATPDPRHPRNLELQWTTLGESLALALNYDFIRAVPGVGQPLLNDPTTHVYYMAGEVEVDTTRQPGQEGRVRPGRSLFDRGQLWLTRFVPFNDTNNNGQYDQSNGSFADPQFGPGIPFAASILDRFRYSRFGSLQSSKTGLININTAPAEVLRLVPMLSPDMEGWMSRLAQSQDELASGPLFDPNNETWDLAAALQAYRDKSLVYTRPYYQSSTNVLELDFRPNATGSTAPSNTAFTSWAERSRREWSRITALREEPGFFGLGELLAVRRDRESTVGTFPSESASADVSMDRLARRTPDPTQGVVRPIMSQSQTPPVSTQNERPIGEPVGLTTAWYRRPGTGGQVPEQRELGNIVNAYENQLMIADAVARTTTIRSDLFAVWFVVEGYTPSDVEGLEPLLPGVTGAAREEPRYTAPMIPTLNRRFLMVVDRSNVVNPGDTPRILMFEELPR
jgi:hypothetical protein